MLVQGTARSEVMAFYGPLIARAEMKAAIHPTLALKDLKAARASAAGFGSRTPVTPALIDLHEQMVGSGEGDLGCHAVYGRLLRDNTPE